MEFIRRPEMFDVVVASNLFGDILTDIGAMISGSLGLAASANLNPDRSVPAMMLRHLGETAAADSVQAAVLRLLEEGDVITPDLGGRSSTQAVGDAVAKMVS